MENEANLKALAPTSADEFIAAVSAQEDSGSAAILKRLRTMAERRVADGYARGDFAVAEPFNVREINDVGVSQIPFWAALVVAVCVAHTWSMAIAGLIAFTASAGALTLLGSTCIELPANKQAQDWQFETYGCTTRCGLWRPMARLIDLGLRLPGWCMLCLIAWGVYSLFTR